jgi:hypothetical protein
MRRITRRLAIGCGCALATATFTGIAVAGNGNGKESAPGQVKKADAVQVQPAVVTVVDVPVPQVQVSAQVQGVQAGSSGRSSAASAAESTSARASAPRRATRQQSAETEASTGSHTTDSRATASGVKPAGTTTHWTHCAAGGSPGAATCGAVAPTPNLEADVSKQYGNGTTAAQIVVSRGGSGAILTGPGNSQPHKVQACGKPGNKSGGVDVHAVKSYAPAECATSTPQPTTGTTSVCGLTSSVTTSAQVVGRLHGTSRHVMTNLRSAHFTKHDDAVFAIDTTAVPTGKTCGTVVPVAPTTPASGTQSMGTSSTSVVQLTGPAATALPATESSGSATGSSAQSAGGVLGANGTVAAPTSKPAGGVRANATNVAGSTLPFTGLPLWEAVLAALALIGGGLAVRRASRPAHGGG